MKRPQTVAEELIIGEIVGLAQHGLAEQCAERIVTASLDHGYSAEEALVYGECNHLREIIATAIKVAHDRGVVE